LETESAGARRAGGAAVAVMFEKEICSKSSVRLAAALVVLLVTACVMQASGLSPFQAPAGQEDPADLYTQAVTAYNQNRFTDAKTLFESVRGNHADDAKRYLANISKYREAMQLAKSVLDRKPDEQDAGSLDFAIAKCQEAIAIKGDGPYKPQEMLAKAQSLRNNMSQQGRAQTQTRDQDLCHKALAASKEHRYREAELAGCALANDDPRYLCGGDEAANVCQEMRDLSKSGGSQVTRGTPPPSDDSSAVSVAGGGSPSTYDKAVAAYDQSDFEGAKKLFRRVTGSDKTNAADYLDKIERYARAMREAAKAASASKLDAARSSYQEAAQIKPDGPGSPQQEAAMLDLRQGVTEFYEGNYAEADRHLAAYANESNQKTDLAHFYLGASKMSEYFLAGGQNPVLRDEAVNDFRVAKKAGFPTHDLEVSPKILKAYEDVSF
jgi:tetratricopeptide (TPR) repeat protein